MGGVGWGFGAGGEALRGWDANLRKGVPTCWLVLASEADVVKHILQLSGDCCHGKDLLVPEQSLQDLSLKDLNHTDGPGNKHNG